MMATVKINERLYTRLEKIARHKFQPIETVVENALAQFAEQQDVSMPDGQEMPQPGTLELLAKLALEADIHSNDDRITDDVSRSREILDEEFADYLVKRVRGESDAT
jgi:hypothetical protein